MGKRDEVAKDSLHNPSSFEQKETINFENRSIECLSSPSKLEKEEKEEKEEEENRKKKKKIPKVSLIMFRCK